MVDIPTYRKSELFRVTLRLSCPITVPVDVSFRQLSMRNGMSAWTKL